MSKATDWKFALTEHQIYRKDEYGRVEYMTEEAILRRINAHDGLVEALKHITKPVEKGDCCHAAFMKGDTEFENHLFDVAAEALAAVGVKDEDA